MGGHRHESAAAFLGARRARVTIAAPQYTDYNPPPFLRPFDLNPDSASPASPSAGA